MLEKIEEAVFEDCRNLSVIWIDDDSLLNTDGTLKDHIVLLCRDTIVGDVSLWELRQQNDVMIPDGIELIEERWFMNSQIETVTIPASVKKIEKEAFRGCQQLREVKFAEGSNIESIGELCFAYSGIQEIELPPKQIAIARNAFKGCTDIIQNR